jgi:serine/threonine-protein kinase RsbW
VAAAVGTDLVLALSEACSNAVRHASAGLSYRVRLCVDDSRCLMEVRDHGPGFDPGVVPAPGVNAYHGRGLLIMRTVVDKLHIDPLQPHGTQVVMVKNWSRSLPGHGADGRVDDLGQRAGAA